MADNYLELHRNSASEKRRGLFRMLPPLTMPGSLRRSTSSTNDKRKDSVAKGSPSTPTPASQKANSIGPALSRVATGKSSSSRATSSISPSAQRKSSSTNEMLACPIKFPLSWRDNASMGYDTLASGSISPRNGSWQVNARRCSSRAISGPQSDSNTSSTAMTKIVPAPSSKTLIDATSKCRSSGISIFRDFAYAPEHPKHRGKLQSDKKDFECRGCRAQSMTQKSATPEGCTDPSTTQHDDIDKTIPARRTINSESAQSESPAKANDVPTSLWHGARPMEETLLRRSIKLPFDPTTQPYETLTPIRSPKSDSPPKSLRPVSPHHFVDGHVAVSAATPPSRRSPWSPVTDTLRLLARDDNYIYDADSPSWYDAELDATYDTATAQAAAVAASRSMQTALDVGPFRSRGESIGLPDCSEHVHVKAAGVERMASNRNRASAEAGANSPSSGGLQLSGTSVRFGESFQLRRGKAILQNVEEGVEGGPARSGDVDCIRE